MNKPERRVFASQHEKLNREIDRIQGREFRSPAPEAGIAAVDLERAIGAFRTSLREHFAFEESEEGGYLRQVIAARPTLKKSVERLLADHGAILAALADLELASRANQSSATIKSRFVNTVRHLRHHESEEMELLQHALMDDIGVCD